MTVQFFPRPSEFRKWLEQHHATARELVVGFHTTGSTRPSITWPESVDEALCFGWIDGIRKRIDATSYTIRFTPRKAGSTWSAVNIRRAEALVAQARMRPPGAKAFAARKENRSRIYSYEQRPEAFPQPYARTLENDREAAAFFAAQPPSYRRAACWWVISAAKEETRLKRLRILIEDSANSRRLSMLARPQGSGKAKPVAN